MNLSELVTNQVRWERERGIVNPNDNLERTQDELNEAFEETDDFKRLQEMVDVCIILAGGMGLIVERLGLPTRAVDELLASKVASNEEKYDLDTFKTHNTETAISRSRHYWKVDPDDWDNQHNEYY